MTILHGTGTRAGLTVVVLVVTRLSVAAQDVGDVAHARFRPRDAESTQAATDTVPTQALLLWGGADADGELYLNPAFVVNAPPALPDAAAGEHRIAGGTASGDELFSVDFAMPKVADGDGSSSFVFVLPG